MIRFALHIHLRSPSAYQALRGSNVIKLPCERTLRDYTNTVHPSTGFHKAVFNDLKNQAGKLNDIQKYVVLMLDEVSIKDDLVYDKVTGELVGFVNLGNDVDDCYTIRNKERSTGTPNIATHALVCMVTSIAARLKYSLGYFATTIGTADQLFLLMWKAIGLLETYADLKVVVVVSDKACPNQRLYIFISLVMKLLIEQRMYLQLISRDISTLCLTPLISLKLPETTWPILDPDPILDLDPILDQDQTQEDCGTMGKTYFGNTSLIFLKLTKRVCQEQCQS